MLQQTPSTANNNANTSATMSALANTHNDGIVVFATSSIKITRPKAIKRKSSKRRPSSSTTASSSSSGSAASAATPTFNFLVTSPYYPPPKPTKITSIPSILIDFTAMTLCDLMRTRKSNRSLPEYVYFVQKVTHQTKINVRTLLVALIYLQRAKSKLPERAIGSDDTIHRMFLAAILIASKYLDNSAWTTHTLTNYQIYTICNGLFSFDEVQQIERGFLKLLQYECFVDDDQLNKFVEEHRVELGLF